MNLVVRSLKKNPLCGLALTIPEDDTQAAKEESTQQSYLYVKPMNHTIPAIYPQYYKPGILIS